jgi:hypothetical protein
MKRENPFSLTPHIEAALVDAATESDKLRVELTALRDRIAAIEALCADFAEPDSREDRAPYLVEKIREVLE